MIAGFGISIVFPHLGSPFPVWVDASVI